MRAFALCAGLALLLAGCRHAQDLTAGSVCERIERDMDWSKPPVVLNGVSYAFQQGCYDQALAYGAAARERFGLKKYSLTREAMSVFVPEEKVASYTLESYERGFLTVLLADSYLKKKKAEDARVELRRLDDELYARSYNWGEDPVNLLLSAVLWERSGAPSEARVDWLRLRDESGELKGLEPQIREFARLQVGRIDGGGPRAPWRVYGAGEFPEPLWRVKARKKTATYYAITPQRDFAPPCASATGLRLSTRRWFDKLAARYDAGYHPLNNAESWLRLSVGTVYSVVPAIAGTGVAAGGCAAGAAASVKGGGSDAGLDICSTSLRMGGALMAQAPRVWRGAVRPDLRHWGYVPAAFIVTTAPSLSAEPCAQGLPDEKLAAKTEF